MLEKQLAALLASTLGLFIRDLNEDQLQVSLWSGEVTLQNLQLQPDVLERVTEVLLSHTPTSSPPTDGEAAAKKALLLPFTVAKGVIQELRLHIPWMSLDTEAVRVEVNGVELVLAPLRAKPVVAGEETLRREVMKEQQLAEYETRRQSTADTDSARKPVANAQRARSSVPAAGASHSPSSPATSSSFLQRLLEGLYRNVHVTAHNVAVRYVLDYPGLHPSLAGALSVAVDEVFFSPTSSDFTRPAFLPTAGNETASNDTRRTSSATGASTDPECRAAHLTHVTVAVHAQRVADVASTTTRRASSTAAFSQDWQHTEVLMSCDSLALHVKNASSRSVSAYGDENRPVTQLVDIVVSLGDQLDLDLSFGALALLAHLARSLTDGFVGVSYRPFLPLLGTTVRTPSNARALARQRWAFALACVSQDVRRARRLDEYVGDPDSSYAQPAVEAGKPQTRLGRVVAFGQLRREYCDLWKRSRRFYWLPPLEPCEAERMRKLESEATLSQLVLLRAFAYAEIDVERAQRLQQDAWIAEKAGRARSSGDPAVASRKSTGSLLRWFGFGEEAETDAKHRAAEGKDDKDADAVLQRRLQNGGSYTFRDLTGCSEPLHVSFEAEWALAKQFLDERWAARAPKLFSLTDLMRPRPATSPHDDEEDEDEEEEDDNAAGMGGTPSGVAVATPAVNLSVRIVSNRLTASLHARCDYALNPSMTALRQELLLQHFHQQLILQVRGLEWFFSPAMEPREDKARTSLYVKSFSAHFAGVVNTPLILSREGERQTVAPGSHGDRHTGGSLISASPDEDFLVVKENATQTRLTLTMACCVVVVRPLHEMYWWVHDVSRLLYHVQSTPTRETLEAVLPPAAAGVLVAPPTPVPQPLLDCTVAPFAVIVPLFAHDLTFEDLRRVSPGRGASSPTSIVGSLNSTAAPDDASAGSFGSVASLFGSSANNGKLLLSGEPCLILSVPSGIRLTTVTGRDKRHQGPHRELYLRVGDESKSVRLSCQTATRLSAMRSRNPRPSQRQSEGSADRPFSTTARKDILSFSMLEVIVNPSEIGVVLEMGMEVTLDPQVVGLINDQLLRPDALYGGVEQVTTTTSVLRNVEHSRDAWRFTSAQELLMRNGEVAFTMHEDQTRHYATLLAQHHAKLHPSWRQGFATPSPSVRATCDAVTAAPGRRLSFMAGLLKVRLCDEQGVELMEAELVNPHDEEAPAASAPYREVFSFLGGGPRALEVTVSRHGGETHLFVCAPDIALNTSVGASVATVEQLCVSVTKDASGALVVQPSMRHVSLVMARECHAALQVLARVRHTLSLPDVDAEARDMLGNRRASAEAIAETDVHFDAAATTAPQSAPKSLRCVVEAGSASVLLPLSREVGMPGCALDATLSNLRVVLHTVDDPSLCETLDAVAPYKSSCNVTALLVEALRVDEDSTEQEGQSYIVMGPPTRCTAEASRERKDTRARGVTVRVSVRTPFPLTPDTVTAPELSVDVTDGYLCAYMPFITHLFYTMKDPLYTDLAKMAHAAARQGFLSNRLLVPRRSRHSPNCGAEDEDAHSGSRGRGLSPDHSSDSFWHDTSITVALKDAARGSRPDIQHPTAPPSSPSPPPPKLNVRLHNVELYLPTNNALAVDVADDSTFFLLFSQELTIQEKRVYDDQGTMRRRLLIDSTSLFYHDGGMGPLLPMNIHLTVVVEFGVLLVPKEADAIASTFQYINGAPGDACVRVSVGPVARNTSAKTAPEHGPPTAVALTMQASRVVALVEMIQFNLGRPLFPLSVQPLRPPGSTTILVTSAPIDLVVTDHAELASFRARLKDGMQYYKAGGGRWQDCPSQRVFLSGIQLDALAQAVPGQMESRSVSPVPLFSSSAARLITELSLNRSHLHKTISTVVEVDSADVYLDNPRHWLRLYDLLVQPCLLSLRGDEPMDHLSGHDSDSSVSSRQSGLESMVHGELVSIDLRLGVRNVVVRLGDGTRKPQLLLAVPEVLCALEQLPRAVKKTVTLQALSAAPVLRIYYPAHQHGLSCDPSHGATDPLTCVDLLHWETEAVSDGLAAASAESTRRRCGVSLVSETYRSLSAPSTPPSDAAVSRHESHVTVTVCHLRLVPHIEAYGECMRLIQSVVPDVRAAISEYARLRSVFPLENCPRTSPPEPGAVPPPVWRVVLEHVAVHPPASASAGTCWLALGRVVCNLADPRGEGETVRDALTVQIDDPRVMFKNYYPIALPRITVRYDRVCGGAEGAPERVTVAVEVMGNGTDSDTILFSCPHLVALATAFQSIRQQWPAIQQALSRCHGDCSEKTKQTVADTVAPPLVPQCWSMHVHVHKFDVALTSSEYTSSDRRLQLFCQDPVRVTAAAHPHANGRSCVEVVGAVEGRFRLTDSDQQTLAHRDVDATRDRGAADWAPHSTLPDDTLPPTLSVHAQLGRDEAPPLIDVSTTGVRLCATHGALSYARRLTRALRPDLARVVAVLREGRPLSTAPTALHEGATARGAEVSHVSFVVHSIAAEVGDDALVEILNVRVQPTDVRRLLVVLAKNEAALHSKSELSEAALSIGSVLLRSRRSGVIHTAVEEPSVTLRSDHVLRVLVPHVTVRSDGSPFFVDMLHSVSLWQSFVRAEATTSLTASSVDVGDSANGVPSSWLHGVVAEVRDVRVQCYHAHALRAPSDGGATTGALSPCAVELQIASLDMSHGVGEEDPAAAQDSGRTGGACRTSVDARGCLVVRKDAQDVVDGTFPPLLNPTDVSLKIEPGLDAKSGGAQDQVTLRTSPITVHLPMGDTLADCTEALARAVLPIVSYARSDAAYRAFRNRPSASEAVQLAVSHDEQGRIVSAVPHQADLVPLSSTVPLARTGEGDSENESSPGTALTFFRFTIYVPRVTVALFTAAVNTRTERHSRPSNGNAARGSHLFVSVQLDEISAERARGRHSSVFLVDVTRITSQAQSTSLFTLCTANHSDKIALQWRDETLHFPSTDMEGTDVEKHDRILTVMDAEVVVSPVFLIVLNERCVAPAVLGFSRALAASGENAAAGEGDDDEEGAAQHSVNHFYGASYQAYHDPLDVDSDLLLQRDLVLGGPGGIQLQFCKNSAFGARNTLTVRSVNHARLILMPMPVTGDPPVLVHEGLTITIESTPVVLVTSPSVSGSAEHAYSAGAPHDRLSRYVRLGARSVFLVPDAALVQFEGHAAVPLYRSKVGVSVSAAARLRRALQRCHDLRVSVGLDFRLLAHNESIQLRTQLVGNYTRETLTTPPAKEPPFTRNTVEAERSRVELRAEHGDFRTTHLWFACSDGPVTEDDNGLTVHIRRAEERTVVHVVISPLQFNVSRNHMRLLYEALVQMAHARNRLRSVTLPGISAPSAAGASRDGTTPLTGAVVLGSSQAREEDVSGVADDDSSLPVKPPQGDDDRRDDDAGATTVEIRVTAPQVEVVVGDDFFTPLIAVAVEAVSLATTSDRRMQAVAAVGALTLKCTDFPSPSQHHHHHHQQQQTSRPSEAARTLLSVSPDLALQLDRFPGGGVSASLSIDCGNVEATVPVTRLLRALRYPWEVEQAAHPVSFHNLTGLSLLLLASPPARAPDGASQTGANAPAPLFCYVRSGAVQPLTSLLRGGQPVLRIVHEPEPLQTANLFDRLSYLYALGTRVDLRQMSDGHTCRFALEGSQLGVSTGVLDVVLRFDGASRAIHATSAVQFSNELEGRTVQLLATGVTAPTHALMPRESCFVPLPLLHQPLGVSVDDTYSSERSEGALPFEQVLSAWSLVPAQTRGATALKIPMWLRRHDSDSDKIAVQLVMEKQLAKQSAGDARRQRGNLQKYEISCRLRPFASVVNLVGLKVTLEVLLPDTTEAAASLEADHTSGLCVSRHVLEHGAQFDWYPTSLAEAAATPHFLLKIHVPVSLRDRHMGKCATQVTMETTLEAVGAFPLSVAAETQLLALQVAGSTTGGSAGRPSVLVRRLTSGVLQLLPLARVRNALPVPIRISFADSTQTPAVIGGTVAQVFPEETLPLFWTTHKNKARDDPVKVCVAAGSMTSRPSNPIVIHGVLNPLATTLSSLEPGGGVYVFAAAVTNALETSTVGSSVNGDSVPAALLTVSPLWLVRNDNARLTLRVQPSLKGAAAQPPRSQGGEGDQTAHDGSHVQEVEALSEAPLTYFPGVTSSRLVEPCAAFQYVLPRDDDSENDTTERDIGQPRAFAWSTPLLLGEVATAASYVTLRHELAFEPQSSDATTSPLPKTATSSAPPESPFFTVFHHRPVPSFYGDVVSDEYFGCLTVSTRVDAGNHCAFHVQLVHDAQPAPVLIENRTSYTIQCGQQLPTSAGGDNRVTLVAAEQTAKLRDSVVLPYTDCAMCWTEPFLGVPLLRLTAYSNATISAVSHSRAWHTTTQDLRRLASANEPVALGDSPLFVYVSPRREDSRCFIVTIMDTRKLASQLLFFPRMVGHVEFVIKSISIFVASECVAPRRRSLAETPLGDLARSGALRPVSALCSGVAAVRQEEDERLLEGLKHCELDVVWLRLANVGLTALVNEKYLLLGIGVGEMVAQDCTSPSPRFPVLIQVDPLPDTTTSRVSSTGEATGVALAFMASVQFQWPEFSTRDAGRRRARPRVQQASTLPIEEATASLGNVTVRLDDRFLMVCRDTLSCLVEARHAVWEADTLTVSREARLTLSANSSMSRTLLLSPNDFSLAKSTIDDDDEFDDLQFTARQLLATQRAMRVREQHDRSVVDCYVSFLHISELRTVLTIALAQADGWNPLEDLMLFGLELPSVDAATLTLKPLSLRDIVRRGDSLASLLGSVVWSAYRGQVFLQACRIVGSLAILGNPLALVEGWSRGVRSLFDDAIVHKRPLVGTRAFLKQVTSSTLHSIGLISGAGSRALALLGPGQSLTAWHETSPSGRHARRSSRFLRDLAVGVSGVITQPIRGARQSGVQGFFSGVATGLVGALTRPVAGALSDVSGAAESFSKHLQSSEPTSATSVASGLDAQDVSGRYVTRGRNFWASSAALPSDQSLLFTASDTADHAHRFVAASVYQAASNEASRKGLFGRAGARHIIGLVGAHNYALYASYKAFLQDTTPEEFSNWVDVAVDAHLSRELTQLLEKPQKHTVSSAKVGIDPQDMARARNIKLTLGIPALLKHATLEQVVCVCTLQELRANIVAEDLQSKCGMLIANRAVAELLALLTATV